VLDLGMFLQITGVCTLIGTMGTMMRFLSTVCHVMFLKERPVEEQLATHRAVKLQPIGR